jgi:hypothetical protein
VAKEKADREAKAKLDQAARESTRKEIIKQLTKQSWTIADKRTGMNTLLDGGSVKVMTHWLRQFGFACEIPPKPPRTPTRIHFFIDAVVLSGSAFSLMQRMFRGRTGSVGVYRLATNLQSLRWPIGGSTASQAEVPRAHGALHHACRSFLLLAAIQRARASVGLPLIRP